MIRNEHPGFCLDRRAVLSTNWAPALLRSLLLLAP
jgi:hypothetical protein